MTEKYPGGVKSDPPIPSPPPVNETQGGRRDKVHPNAIHDRYPPIGTREAPVITKETRSHVKK